MGRKYTTSTARSINAALAIKEECSGAERRVGDCERKTGIHEHGASDISDDVLGRINEIWRVGL